MSNWTKAQLQDMVRMQNSELNQLYKELGRLRGELAQRSLAVVPNYCTRCSKARDLETYKRVYTEERDKAWTLAGELDSARRKNDVLLKTIKSIELEPKSKAGKILANGAKHLIVANCDLEFCLTPDECELALSEGVVSNTSVAVIASAIHRTARIAHVRITNGTPPYPPREMFFYINTRLPGGEDI